MRGTRSPISVLNEQLSELIAHLSGVCDGRDEAIHDARVATRRIRETLVLARPNFDEAEFSKIADTLNRAGKALGDARDADIINDVMRGLDTRLPFPAAAIAGLRRSVAQERQTGRRRLIKTLEGLDLEAIPRRLARAERHLRFLGRRTGPGWRETLRDHLAARAADVRAAMQRAGGVYFPNRSHAARVAVKKLRYALELAGATGAWRAPAAIRRLKKAQEALGDAHDRQVLTDRLRRLPPPETNAAGAAEIDAVVGFLEAETLTLHGRYLKTRDDIAAICDACDRFAHPRRRARALLAAGVALPSLLLLRRKAGVSAVAQNADADHLRVNVRVS